MAPKKSQPTGQKEEAQVVVVDVKPQVNFRLTKKMTETLKSVSTALNMSQAEFLEFLFWRYAQKAVEDESALTVELTSKALEELKKGRAQAETPVSLRR